MMRFLGISVAKPCRRGMQYRDFSSAADVTTSNKIVGRFAKLAFGGAGYVCGGLTVNPIGKNVRSNEESLIRENKRLDEMEAELEASMLK
uniref:Uncharacterized protein n=2 Tax=Noccaea caerulescens TaxID=107243 RepID=A0A1J3F7C0_NOCCA